MKASNIYQTLKTKGYATDGTKPMLPGVGSPLNKSPYKFNAGLKKAAADGSLDSNTKFKNAVESSPYKLAPVVAAIGKKLLVGAAKKAVANRLASPHKLDKNKPTAKEEKYGKYGYKKEVVKPISTSYNSKTGELTKVFSDKDVKDKGIKKVQVTKASEKSPTTKAKVKSPASMNSPAKKKSCGSPAKMEIGAEAGMPLDVAARPNPKRAMRKAKRRANRGTKAAVKKFKACKRSIGKGRGNKI